MESHKLSPEAANRLSDNAAMVEEATKEIRTISHLLHPPLLDEAGLASALRCYVAGFSERSRIATKLDMPQNLAGLSKDAELSIFRVCRNALPTSIGMPGSPTAEIRITQQETCLRVEIEDAGKGISPEKEPILELSANTGVGLRGSRERLRPLGGTPGHSLNRARNAGDRDSPRHEYRRRPLGPGSQQARADLKP